MLPHLAFQPEAVGAFLGPLQQAIDCLTPTVLKMSGGYFAADRPHALTLGDGDRVALQGASRYTSPHLYLGAGAEIAFAPLRHAHLPTGRIVEKQRHRVPSTPAGMTPAPQPRHAAG